MKINNSYSVFAVRSFEKDLFKLARKYPKVLDNVADLFERLEGGSIEGDPVPRLNLNGDKVFKTRLENPDANKGKSGGFRVIWYLVTSKGYIYPLTIYSKSDQEDISSTEIRKLAKQAVTES